MRAMSIRSRSYPRCPRPEWAPCSRCWPARTELSVIAVIGILLLIGIVKKNGIMMVDFALETERKEGKETGGGDLPGLSSAVPADHDDHHGRGARCFASGRGNRGCIRAPPAARHHHRRRTYFQPGAHALHDAGDVPLPRSFQALDEGQARGRAVENDGRNSDGPGGPVTSWGTAMLHWYNIFSKRSRLLFLSHRVRAGRRALATVLIGSRYRQPSHCLLCGS